LRGKRGYHDTDDITQIIIAGQRTGIVGLKKRLEEVAREYASRADGEINDITSRKENHHGD